MVLLCLAFVIIGDVAVKERDTPLEDWWFFRFYRREHPPGPGDDSE